MSRNPQHVNFLLQGNMKLVLLLSVSILLVFAWSCKSKKKGMETTEPIAVNEELPVLTLSAKSCRGKCEVYQLVLDASGVVTYEGTKNVDNIGIYTAKWDMNEVEALIDSAEFTELDSSYLSGARDIQEFEINYNEKNVIFFTILV